MYHSVVRSIDRVRQVYWFEYASASATSHQCKFCIGYECAFVYAMSNRSCRLSWAKSCSNISECFRARILSDYKVIKKKLNEQIWTSIFRIKIPKCKINNWIRYFMQSLLYMMLFMFEDILGQSHCLLFINSNWQLIDI